jgi:hypothetical protein
MTPGDDAGIGKEIEMDIEMLGAGRVLDYFVAERVMGWLWVVTEGKRYLANPECTLPQATGEEPMWQGDYIFVPHYSTDIAAAWHVVLKMRELNYSFDAGSWENMDDGNDWDVCFEHQNELVGRHSQAPSFELAICQAAIKAIEISAALAAATEEG